MTTTTYLLTGDIGGTNSRMALYDTTSSCSSADTALVSKTYSNKDHFVDTQLSEENKYQNDPTAYATNIIGPFVKYCLTEQTQVKLNSNCIILATLASAGVVDNNRVHLTNLGNLLIDGTAIANNESDEYLKRVKVCKIINDFVAQGYGCLTLTKDDVKHLYGPNNLNTLPIGPKVCIGAGTGLGECYLTPNNDDAGEYTCFPSEGGHVEFAPRNDLEIGLFKYLTKKLSSVGRISVERVVSGIGLANVYEFLVHEYPDRVDANVQKEFENPNNDKGKVVGENAKPNTLCGEALSILMNAYGCETGSAAIKWIPTGGLFVTGGLTPKNIQYIEGHDSDFMKAYLNKGRVSPVLMKIPLFAVMTEDLGVRGVHKAAKMEYEKYQEAARDAQKTGASNKRAWGELVKESSVLLMGATALSFTMGMVVSNRRR